jgi:hypothetical protein
VNQRFQIEDLIVQDACGVTFRVTDLETQQPAALRRLFPFGVNGGGLDESEQAAYQRALDQCALVKHPALRAILVGGTDPVDGLPYLATEWVEGLTLQSFVDNAPLSPAEATFLITQALEVCELLSQALGRESVWVETDLNSIVVGASETGRGFTFWVSPMKCLGKGDGQHGLEPIVTLVENMLGWRGKAVTDQDGGGLGAWLKWLRLSALSATLKHAREKLADSLRDSSPPPVRRAVRQAVRTTTPQKLKKKSSALVTFAAIGGLCAFALGGYALVKWNDSRQPSPPEPLAALEVELAPASASIPEPQSVPQPEIVTKQEISPEPPASAVENAEEKTASGATEFKDMPPPENTGRDTKAIAQKTPAPANNGVFTIADTEFIATQDGVQVSLEGTLVGLKKSKSEKTLYLLFSEKATDGEVRGSIRTSSPDADLTQESLTPLIGKTIKIQGKVFMESNFDKKRPNIVVENRASIELK